MVDEQDLKYHAAIADLKARVGQVEKETEALREMMAETNRRIRDCRVCVTQQTEATTKIEQAAQAMLDAQKLRDKSDAKREQRRAEQHVKTDKHKMDWREFLSNKTVATNLLVIVAGLAIVAYLLLAVLAPDTLPGFTETTKSVIAK